MLTIALAGSRLGLSRDSAAALVEYLWMGRLPGAVTSAAKLSEALAARDARRPSAVAFEPYEVKAVRDALAALGLGG